MGYGIAACRQKIKEVKIGGIKNEFLGCNWNVAGLDLDLRGCGNTINYTSIIVN